MYKMRKYIPCDEITVLEAVDISRMRQWMDETRSNNERRVSKLIVSDMPANYWPVVVLRHSLTAQMIWSFSKIPFCHFTYIVQQNAGCQ